MRRNLGIDDLGDLLECPILAVLSTHYRDGQVLLSPVWHEWRDGGFNILTWAQDVKSKHLHRDPRATVLVAEAVPPFRSLEVRGEARLSRPPNAQEMIRRLAIRYYGPADGEVRAKTYEGVDLERIRLEPGTIRAWDFADEL